MIPQRVRFGQHLAKPTSLDQRLKDLPQQKKEAASDPGDVAPPFLEDDFEDERFHRFSPDPELFSHSLHCAKRRGTEQAQGSGGGVKRKT
jgi:hypothetical protein